jgi:hypothetical protein
MGSWRFPPARFCDNHLFMAKSTISDNQKKRRRPKTGVTPMTGVRFSDQALHAIERWAKRQSGKLTRAEAIRRLVSLGLSAPIPAERDPNAASKALKLAAAQVRGLIDPLLPEEERRARRRRLIRGPKEFRDARRDQPKKPK